MKNKLIIDLNGVYLNYVYLVDDQIKQTIEIKINQDLSNYAVQSLRWLSYSEKIDYDSQDLAVYYVNGPGSFNNVRIASLIVKMLKLFHKELKIYETNKLALYADEQKKEVDFLSTSKNIYFVYVHDGKQVLKPLQYVNLNDFEQLKKDYPDFEVVDLTSTITSDSQPNDRIMNLDNVKLINSVDELKANYLKEPNIDQHVLNKTW